MDYTEGTNACWIGVHDYGGRFRALTNNERAYAQVARLSFHDNRADAQADLDKLAGKLGWKKVEVA